MTATNFLLWAAPVLFLLIGAFAAVRFIQRRAAEADATNRTRRPGGRPIVTRIHRVLCRDGRRGGRRGLLPPAATGRPSAKGEPASPRPSRRGRDRRAARSSPAPSTAGVSNFPWKNPTAAERGAPRARQRRSRLDGGGHAQLEASSQANPDDAEGWRMLGRTYLVTKRPRAASARTRKRPRSPAAKDPGLELDLAEALVLTDDPAVQDRAGHLIVGRARGEPSNQKALWYSGVLAYARGRQRETAKTHWPKLLDQNPPDGDPPDRRRSSCRRLASRFQPCRTRGRQWPDAGRGMGGGDDGRPTGAGDGAQGRTIRIAVSVDPSLWPQAEAGHTALRVGTPARHPGPAARGRATLDGRSCRRRWS